MKYLSARSWWWLISGCLLFFIAACKSMNHPSENEDGADKAASSKPLRDESRLSPEQEKTQPGQLRSLEHGAKSELKDSSNRVISEMPHHGVPDSAALDSIKNLKNKTKQR